MTGGKLATAVTTKQKYLTRSTNMLAQTNDRWKASHCGDRLTKKPCTRTKPNRRTKKATIYLEDQRAVQLATAVTTKHKVA